MSTFFKCLVLGETDFFLESEIVLRSQLEHFDVSGSPKKTNALAIPIVAQVKKNNIRNLFIRSKKATLGVNVEINDYYNF